MSDKKEAMDRLIAQDADLIERGEHDFCYNIKYEKNNTAPPIFDQLGKLLSQLDENLMTDNERAEILIDAYKRITRQPQTDALKIARDALERIEVATRNEVRAGDKGYVSRYGINGIARAALDARGLEIREKGT